MCDGVHGSVPSSLRPSCVTTYETSGNSCSVRRSSPAISLALSIDSPVGSCTCSHSAPSSSSGRNSRPVVAPSTTTAASTSADAT